MMKAVGVTAAVLAIFGAYKLGESSSMNNLTDDSTLRLAAKGTGIFIGAAMNQRFMKLDSNYSALGAQEYSLLTEENGCKMT